MLRPPRSHSCGVARLVVQGLGAATLLTSNEVDGAPVNEREDPRARLGTIGAKSGGRAPDPEERLLNGVLRQPVVPEHAECEAVGDAADAVVELGERDSSPRATSATRASSERWA